MFFILIKNAFFSILNKLYTVFLDLAFYIAMWLYLYLYLNTQNKFLTEKYRVSFYSPGQRYRIFVLSWDVTGKSNIAH